MTMRIAEESKVDQVEIKNALESGDADKFAETIVKNIQANGDRIQQEIIEEAKNFNIENTDASILAQRGFKPLTATERKYYNEVKDKHSFDGLELPKTVFDRVFEDLTQNHPLLSEINFVNVTGVTEWVVRKDDVEPAWWGKLCDEIKKKLDNGFETIKTDLYKVSAYVPVCKAMLALGPEWLDRYVRTILAESIALAMEKVIIAGEGGEEPIGIIKKINEVSEGKNQDKEAKALSDFSPESIGGEILAPLAKGKNGLGRIMLIVSSTDYYKKFYPLFNIQDENGVYHKQSLPFDGIVIESNYMPEGKMAVGEAKNYFMGIGSALKIEHSDEYRFLEEQRVYIAKQYANGRPRKDEDFLVFDIKDTKLKKDRVPGA
ncbi:MAG: phage major capsid protein [Anaerococcus prevotii]|uniref:phage major capsid protein n=1 Tax=Anaerococcus prevotii TaxID=33034 RepID=UPI0028FE1D8D|nr:phage major capsid protein [Anaerococcus prevotii]MDU2557423.1 phage major capsid protein [Anaerococcus prevotii]